MQQHEALCFYWHSESTGSPREHLRLLPRPSPPPSPSHRPAPNTAAAAPIIRANLRGATLKQRAAQTATDRVWRPLKCCQTLGATGRAAQTGCGHRGLGATPLWKSQVWLEMSQAAVTRQDERRDAAPAPRQRPHCPKKKTKHWAALRFPSPLRQVENCELLFLRRRRPGSVCIFYLFDRDDGMELS